MEDLVLVLSSIKSEFSSNEHACIKSYAWYDLGAACAPLECPDGEAAEAAALDAQRAPVAPVRRAALRRETATVDEHPPKLFAVNRPVCISQSNQYQLMHHFSVEKKKSYAHAATLLPLSVLYIPSTVVHHHVFLFVYRYCMYTTRAWGCKGYSTVVAEPRDVEAFATARITGGWWK